MYQNLKTYLRYGRYFCGVEHTTQNGQDIIYTALLKKNKNTLEIEGLYDQTSINNINFKLPKKQHIFLIINNENVLTKCVENQQIESIKLVYEAFPNINLDDFYYEIIAQQKKCFVSICRKSYADAIISEYEENNISVINISLGSTIISSIIEYLDFDYVWTSNIKISIDNKSIAAIENMEINDIIDYDINGLWVRNTYLISFTGAINSLLSHFHSITNLNSLKQTLRSNYNQAQFHKQFLKFGLYFVLTILLLNFIAYNHYFNQIDMLRKTFQINQESKLLLDELNNSVNKSQKTIEDILKSSSSKSTFYVNEIIQNLPNSILLSELNFQPVLKNINDGVSIEIFKNIILVSGESNNSKLFSRFINDLEKLRWIKRVEIVNYEDGIKPFSIFSLKININDENQN